MGYAGRSIEEAVQPNSLTVTGRWLARAGLVIAVLAAGGASQPGAAQATAVQAPAASRAPLRVMPLGDSLTYGVGSSTGDGYRRTLRAELGVAGVAVDFVGSQRSGVGADADNEGHPGWRTEDLAAYLPDWLAAAQPDVVLLDIGTNDIIQRYGAAVAAARTAGLLDRITRQLPRVRVVVAKLLVVGYAAADFRRYNGMLASIVAARRSRVSLADMSRISPRSTVDGVHPTDVGYRQMAYQWYQALRPVLAGGRAWPAAADPFPLPSVRLVSSARAVRRGGLVTFTARLAGRLTEADLGRAPVRLLFRRAGTDRWLSLGISRTDGTGLVRFARRAPGTGYFLAAVAGGRAAGRRSSPVRVSS